MNASTHFATERKLGRDRTVLNWVSEVKVSDGGDGGDGGDYAPHGALSTHGASAMDSRPAADPSALPRQLQSPSGACFVLQRRDHKRWNGGEEGRER